MKNQWFADVSDYRKYGLLRLIAKNTGMKVGVCWMLTPPDGKPVSENRLKYLNSPERWENHDETLYNFLRRQKEKRNFSVSAIENDDILPTCTFYREKLKDDSNREDYFGKLKHTMQDCDVKVIFIDTDNGMEVPSTRKGCKDCSKYLYWLEAKDLYEAGFSLLIFQYNWLRRSFAEEHKYLYDKFKANLGTRPQCYYHAGYGKIFLIAHDKHEEAFKRVNREVQRRWQGKMKIGELGHQ